VSYPARTWKPAALALSLIVLPALACNAGRAGREAPTAAPPAATAAPAATDSPPASPTVVPTLTLPPDTATPALTATPAATATPEATPLPAGACLEPPHDYEQVIVNGEAISRRTLWMLERAKELYVGPADILRVTQGSYRSDLDTSFGTHAGGGAVDVSIRDPIDNTFLFSETELMVGAMRLAGFAAWYRAPGALGTGSAPHIHAIAIGDRELSPAAQDQLTGAGGYFNGMDGLIPPYGPNPDPHGGPILCPWMDL
jgi:hypothetical protein